jgi:hypothetical protein
VAPVVDRPALFKHDTTAFHGDPGASLCPAFLYRSSLAVFYSLRRQDGQKPPVDKAQWR